MEPRLGSINGDVSNPPMMIYSPKSSDEKGGQGDRPPSRQTMGDSYLRMHDTTADTASIVMAAEKLVAAIAADDGASGGLLSRETIRAADELRVILLRYRARRSA
jgi:hypothetical protein